MIVVNEGARCPFLFIGDHAGRAIPQALGDLGVGREDLARHIAWDIGVAAVGEHLARRLGACFIRQAYSRLVIDCNRAPATVGATPPVSDGVPIPGNTGVPVEQRAARVAAIYQPYQDAIAAELDRRAALGSDPILVSLHSFTPSLQGVPRPWRYGVLHGEDSPFSSCMLSGMEQALGEAVGDNQPYALNEIDNTVPLHAGGRGLDYLELEIRQDLIAEPPGQAEVAAEVAGFLLAALALKT